MFLKKRENFIPLDRQEIRELLNTARGLVDQPHHPEYTHPAIHVQCRFNQGIAQRNDEKEQRLAQAYLGWLDSSQPVQEVVEELHSIMTEDSPLSSDIQWCDQCRCFSLPHDH